MARKPKIIQPARPKRRLLRNRDTASVPGAILPRRGFWYWYGWQLRRHPLRTVLGGAAVLVALGGLAGGGYWYFHTNGKVLAWHDSPDAAVNAVPPYAKWQPRPTDIYGGAAVQVMQDGPKKVLRFIGAANTSSDATGTRSQRAELSPKMPDLHPGQEVWVGMDVKLNADLGNAQGFQQIFQVRNSVEGSPSLVMSANGSDGLALQRQTGPNATDVDKLPLGALPTTAYSRIILGMKMTRSSSSSWVEAWRDNQPVVLRSNWDSYNQAGDGQSGGLLFANADSAYLKFGIYRSPQAWPMDVRLGDIKIGPNRDSVK